MWRAAMTGYCSREQLVGSWEPLPHQKMQVHLHLDSEVQQLDVAELKCAALQPAGVG